MLKKVLVGLCLLGLAALVGIWAYIAFTQETKVLDEAARRSMPGQFVALSQGTTHYEVTGPASGPSVVLIHGAGSGYYAWDKNASYLADLGFRVLRYDLYGRGFSDRPEVEYDSVLFDRQLEELLAQTGLQPPYHVVAVSMGASVALHFADTHSKEVGSLTLVDPAALSDGNMAWFLKAPGVSPLLMSLYWYPRAVEKQMREYYQPSKVPEYREKSWEQLHYAGIKRAMLSTWRHMLTLNMTATMQRIGEKGLPVLVVWGQNDPLLPPAVSAHYLKAMPQARYAEIPEAGHLSNYEQPEVFNPILLRFLRNEK